MLNLFFSAIAIYLLINFFTKFYNLFMSSQYKRLLVQNKYQDAKFQQHISVVVYAQNDEENIADIIQKLIRQDYNSEKYKINIILDNCDDDSSKLAEIVGGAYVYRINSEDGKPIGKKAAYSWFLSKVDTYEYTNMYLFLTADMKFSEDFLTQINKSSFNYDVFTGKTDYIYPNTTNLIASLKNKFMENLNFKALSVTGFTSDLNFNFFAIKQEIAEKINLIELFKKSKFDFNYALMQNGAKFFYNDKIAVTKIKEYKNISKEPTRIDKVKRIKVSSLTSGLLFMHQLMPCFASSIILLAFLNLAAFSTYNFYYINAITALNILYAIYFVVSIVKSQLTFKDTLRVVAHKLNMRKLFGFMSFIPQTQEIFSAKIKSLKKESQQVIVTDGNKDLLCKLTLKQENPYKYSLAFKRKKLMTKPELKKMDALQEVIDKLNHKGFTLKVCQNCGFFEKPENISHSTQEGACYNNVINKTRKEPEIVNICGSCKQIIPHDAKKIILSHITKH